jgi:DNA adenine methylase
MEPVSPIKKISFFDTELNTNTTQVASKNLLVRPFLKWAGGKRQLLPILQKHIPRNWGENCYFEPFIGAGALFLALQRPKAVINDTNEELINCYLTIRDFPEQLLELTNQYQTQISKEHYYQLRELDRHPDFEKLSNLERAARILYLNKTCFNGLFRVNSQGQFNVPFGDNKKPQIAEQVVIMAVSKYLNQKGIQILNLDFAESVTTAKTGDFIYFDPPYDPVSDTASFTGYALNGFGKDQQERLKQVSDRLVDKGCKVLLSNSATDFIKQLYSDRRYSIIEVEASRHINSIGANRGKINEVLILNE